MASPRLNPSSTANRGSTTPTPSSALSKRARQIQQDEGITSRLTYRDDPPLPSSLLSSDDPPVMTSGRSRQRAGTLPSRWHLPIPSSSTPILQEDASLPTAPHRPFTLTLPKHAGAGAVDFARHASDISETVHRPPSRLLAELRGDGDGNGDADGCHGRASHNRARSGSLTMANSAAPAAAAAGGGSLGSAFGSSIWRPSLLGASSSVDDDPVKDPWARAAAAAAAAAATSGTSNDAFALPGISSDQRPYSVGYHADVGGYAPSDQSATEHEQLSHLFHAAGGSSYSRNRATTLASMARPNALPAPSTATPSPPQQAGRNRSSTFAPALRGDRFSASFPDLDVDGDDGLGHADTPLRPPSASGAHTPSHHGAAGSLASAALHNRLGQLSGDTAPSSAAVSIVANANRPRAISMGVLDGPTSPPSQVRFGGAAAGGGGGGAAYDRDEADEDPNALDIYAAYALDHGLDLDAFTALAAAAGLPGVRGNGAAPPTAGRLRAGTVAALGGAGPGGRHRTEQELMRMASADPSLARRLHLAGISAVPKPASPGIAGAGAETRHSSYMTAKEGSYAGSMPSSPSALAHSIASPGGAMYSPGMSRAHLGTPQGQTPNRSLWIGNLHPTVTGQELMQVFAPYGAIESLRLLPEKECGFVNFVETADAVRARDDVLNRLGGRIGTTAQATSANGTVRIGFGRIDALPSTAIFGRGVNSAVGTPIGENGPMTPGESPAAPTRALWIGSIPSTTAPATLLSIFTPFGPIESARVLTHKNCGFINFERVDDAIRARKALNGRDVLGPEVGAVRVGYAKVPLKTAEDALPGQQDTAAFSAALEQLHALKGAQSVPVEQQAITGDLDDYRSNMVMSLLHLQKNAAEGLPNATSSSLRDAAEEVGQVQRGIGQLQRGIAAPGVATTNVPLGGGHSATNSTSAAAKLANDPLARLKNPSAATAALGLPSSSNSIVPSSDKGGVPLPSDMAPRASVTEQQLMMRELSEGQEQEVVDVDIEGVAEFRPPTTYYTSIPLVSEVSSNRRFETARLREMKRDIEAGAPVEEVDEMALEYLSDIVDLASDYIGNTVVQKFFERCSERVKLAMLTDVAPHLAMIGIHKNGTWAAQKIIDTSRTNPEMRSLIARHLRPYVPPLLLDQFGNYVVQCVIPFPGTSSDFVFDAMVDRCWEIAQGRFGARSMRACLENALVSRRCQKRVAIAIVLNSVPLATSPNGALLLTWYLDQSNLPGRYRLLAPRFAPHLVQLCTHKVASLAVLRIVNQKNDVATSRDVVSAIFESKASDGDTESSVLEDILTDQVHGSQLITKVLSSTFVDPAAKPAYMERTRQILLEHNLTNVPAYRRLVEELGIPVAPLPVGPLPSFSVGAGGGLGFERAPPGAFGSPPDVAHMMSALQLSSSPSSANGAGAPPNAHNSLHLDAHIYGSSPTQHPPHHLSPPHMYGGVPPPQNYPMRPPPAGAGAGVGAGAFAPPAPYAGAGNAHLAPHQQAPAAAGYYARARNSSFDAFNPWSAAESMAMAGSPPHAQMHPHPHPHAAAQAQAQAQAQAPHGALFAPRASFSQMYEAAGLPRAPMPGPQAVGVPQPAVPGPPRGAQASVANGRVR